MSCTRRAKTDSFEDVLFLPVQVRRFSNLFKDNLSYAGSAGAPLIGG
jgi:hypothetical protein